MSEINAAGEAYAPDMTDPVTRGTWSDAGLAALFDRLRVMYGDEVIDRAYLARIESDGTQGDLPTEVDCRVCEGPSEVVGVHSLDSRWVRLSCGHIAGA